MQEVTFTDCRLWTGEDFERGKITLEGKQITEVGDFPGTRGTEIRCEGLAVIPALIDNHVHFREPGAEEKEDFRTGSAAAAHGGVGTVLEIQNSPPLLTTPERVAAKKQIIAEKSRVKVGLYASATPETLKSIREMAELTSGLKLFMAPSHGDQGLQGEELMRPYFQQCAQLGYTLIVHAEDGAVVRKETKRFGEMGPAFFSKARPPAAEIVAVKLALKLAAEYGTSLHVFHVSTAGATDLIVDAKKNGVNVTSSTCPHYLFFTEEDVARKGGLLKCFPSIKGAVDRERLLAAVRDGDIEILSTDHAPHRPAEKVLPFAQSPAGISSADLLLPLLLTLVARGDLTLADLVRLTVTNPARIHGMLSGTELKEGGVADLVFFDPECRWTVRSEDFLSRASQSPYVGMSLTGRVAATLVDGRPVYVDEQGTFHGKLPAPTQ